MRRRPLRANQKWKLLQLASLIPLILALNVYIHFPAPANAPEGNVPGQVLLGIAFGLYMIGGTMDWFES